MTVTVETEVAVVPGPGGFATPLQPPHLPGPVFPVPRLSAGLRLHGEYQGSGFTEPRYIARRGDGQVVQLSRLLHLVAGAIDGERDTERISHRVSGLFGREVSEENVAYLIENKLIPLGVTVPYGQEDDEVDAPRSDLLLALKGHRVLFDERRVARIGRALAWLHRPAVVAVVLLAAVAMDVWLFGYYGAMTPVLHVLDQPVLLLVVFALTVASLVFHEFGHASACRYGGARPGCIGCGLFLIWPSMYTDVTDVYRIGRAGRIRTDLGGVYFNVVFMLGLTGCYLLTGQPFFLSAVYLGHFEVLEQLMPAVRLDGYYILGDLAGIPDLYGKIRPILLGMIPGRVTPPEVTGLKRSARVIVTAWVCTMVPLLLGDLGYALWNLPRILATGVRSLTEQLAGTADAFAHGQLASGTIGLLGCVMLVCPLAGMTYLSVRLAGRLLRAARRATDGRPRLRASLCALGLVAAGGLCCAWFVGLTPKPLPAQPPIVPVLQPGVPTATPGAPVTHRARPGGAGSGGGTTPAPSPGHTRGGGLVAPSASASPTTFPSASPTATPTAQPTHQTSPTATATGSAPSGQPSTVPSGTPSSRPTTSPTSSATASPPPTTAATSAATAALK
jgi:putative peptide zinc metalloprotease protein